MGITSETLLDECEKLGATCQGAWFAPSEPVHTVQLDAYYFDRYEITNQQFIRFLNELGTHEQICLDEDCWVATDSKIVEQADNSYMVDSDEADLPVTGVTWFGAAAFCAWRDARLPSEAEWEKAARWQPDTGETFIYPWGNEFEGTAVNHCDTNCNASQASASFDDGAAEETVVGSYENGRSPAGIFDLGGNVWEWTSDWFDEAYYTETPGENPTGPEAGSVRTVRGGSWFDIGIFSAAAIRFPAPPTESGTTIGFRCAQNP